jgi:hypothetical protein
MKQAILSLSQFTEGSFPFKYLGVPLSPHRLLASQFSPLIHRLESAIQNWMGKYLSYAGRLELIKSVLHGMVQFWISIFPIPAVVIIKITSLCRNFLWTGDMLRSKSALVAWKQVCLPKDEGGLEYSLEGRFPLDSMGKPLLHYSRLHLVLRCQENRLSSMEVNLLPS